MCDIWKTPKEEIQKEMTYNEIKKFILRDKAILKGVRNIGITGGEALLRNDIVDIIKLLRKELPNTRIGIQSNGLLPDFIEKKMKKIYRIYPEIGFAVSIDGPEKVHDKMRGTKGAYKKAIETIKRAKKIGITEITTGMTITKENYRYITQTRKLCESMGCEFSCFLAEHGEYFQNVGSSIGLTKKELDEIAKSLKQFSYHYYMDNVRLQIEKKRKRRFNCYAGCTSIVINPSGDIKPCLTLPYTLGNVKNSPLNGILYSKKAKKVCRITRKCNKCYLQCEVGVSTLVDISDLICWWLFYCRDKMGFIRYYGKKYSKKFYKNA
jgi:MoaA/NifB/PqqE/SkfB family radical SAM enzyme